MSLDKTNDAIRASEALHHKLAPAMSKELALASQFWAKLISNSKSAAVLIRAGFASQAAVIHRLSIEHFAFMQALVKGLKTLQDVYQQARFETFQYAKALDVAQERDEQAGREVLSKENREGLKRFLENPENNVPSAGITVFNLLDQLDLKFLHDSYRMYSLHAAHANAVSSIWEPSQHEVDELLEGVRELLRVSDALWKEKLASA